MTPLAPLTLTALVCAQATPAAFRTPPMRAAPGPGALGDRGAGAAVLAEVVARVPAAVTSLIVARRPAATDETLSGLLGGPRSAAGGGALAWSPPGTPPTAQGWRARGLDPDAPLVAWTLGGDHPWIVRIGVADAAEARRAFGLLAAGPLDPVRRVDSADDAPWACRLDGPTLLCQRGPGAAAAEPLAELARALHPSGPSLESRGDVIALLAALDADADVYAYTRPAEHARAVDAAAHDWRRRRDFAATEPRPDDDTRRARAYGKLLEQLPGAAASLRVGAGPELAIEVGLSPRARQALGAIPELAAVGLARLGGTPGLVQLRAALPPLLVEHFARSLWPGLPTERLDGELALVVLGLDGRPHVADPYAAPSVFALGLRPRRDPVDPVERWIAGLGAPWTQDGDVWRRVEGDHVDEVRVLDGLLVLATGAGSGAAAQRRIGARAPVGQLPPDTLLDVRVDLGAARAALTVARGERPCASLDRTARWVELLETAAAGRRAIHARARLVDGARLSIRAEALDD
jgi:hypothetical protein